MQNELLDAYLATQRDPSLLTAAEAVKAANEALKLAGDTARSECGHLIVLAGLYYHSDYGGSMPPFRVCACCGFHEQGWGCGYYALKDNPKRRVIEVERCVAYRYATEPERVSGWWIIPRSKTEPCNPYQGYPDDDA